MGYVCRMGYVSLHSSTQLLWRVCMVGLHVQSLKLDTPTLVGVLHAEG